MTIMSTRTISGTKDSGARRAAPDAPRRRRSRASGRPISRLERVLLSVVPAIVLVAVWQLVTALGGSQFFPPPSRIFVRAWELWFSGPASTGFVTELFWSDVIPSISRGMLGWLVAAVIGIVIGSAAGQWRRAAAFIDPPINFIRSLPKPALVPIFLIILGGTDTMRFAFIVFGCIWPVLLNTMQSVRAIDATYRETAKAYHIPPLRTYFRVLLPAASPGIAAGMRVSLSLALILMVLSEWMLASHGLGFFLIDAQRTFHLTDLWAAILLLGVAGFILNVAFVSVERHLMRWHRATSLTS